MGKKSGPAAPPPPDPAATAAAQLAANKEGAVAQANLNRIDQYTPQGAITYTQTGTNADGTPKFRSDQTYSADEQAKYDQNNKIALALNSLAGKNIGRVDEAQSKAFSYDGMTPIQTGVNTSGLPRLQSGPAAPTQSGALTPDRYRVRLIRAVVWGIWTLPKPVGVCRAGLITASLLRWLAAMTLAQTHAALQMPFTVKQRHV